MKIIAWCKGKFRLYAVFSKSILFILGLVFSYNLVEKVFFDILITHLTELKDHHLRRAVIVVNLQEGTSAALQIFFAFLADAYTGLFNMVVGSSTLHIMGLFLTYYAARNGNRSLDIRVFYPALVLMTLSQAAYMITLKSFLGDQLVAGDRPATQEEQENAKKRSNVWWKFVSFLAFIFALFGPLGDVSFRVLSFVLAITMGGTFLWFLLGIGTYLCYKATDSPLSDVVFVIYSAIIKRNVKYPERPEQLFENASDSLQILPHVSWLRWLDRAAVVQDSRSDLNCSVERVTGVKFLLKMLPMWSTFLTFSLVAASGSTFFLEEANSITGDTFPIQIFINFLSFTAFMVSGISQYVLEKLGKIMNNNNAQRMMLVRMGIGMVCCVLCCIAAWANTLHMLHLARKYGSPKNHMSVFWLTPQYFLLGVMEGLSADGLQTFFDSQVSRSISKYGPPFGECVMGVGKFLSVVCILILSRWFKWFQNEPKPRRLDKYYLMLAILSFVNFILYCLLAYWYGDDTFLSRNETGDIESIGSSGSADLQVDSVVPRSLPSKAQHESHRALSRRVTFKSEERISEDNRTENTNPGEPQTHEEPTQTSSTDDHETEPLLSPKSNMSGLRVMTFVSTLYSRVVRRRFQLRLKNQ